MKNIIKYLASSVIFLFLIAGSSVNETSLLGSWSFNVNGAPWEFNSGNMIFEQNEEAELEGKIIFHTGREVTIQNLTFEEEEFEFTVVVDGYDVQAVFSIEEEQIRGRAMSMEGNMSFAATKKVDEE